MDIYGDVIGTDGHNLVMFEPDGKIVKPQINLRDKLYPTYRYKKNNHLLVSLYTWIVHVDHYEWFILHIYSLAVSEETGIIAIVSRQGLLVTYESSN